MKAFLSFAFLLTMSLSGPFASADPTTPPPTRPGNNFEASANASSIFAHLQEAKSDPGSPANAPIQQAGLPAEDPYEYRLSLGCGNKSNPDANDNPTICTYGMSVCVTPTNPTGVLYYSWIRRIGTGMPWRFNGESCSLTALPAAPAPPAIPSLAQIREAFANLPFGKPTVSIQPVGGKTLVNLPTFYEVKWDGSGLEPGSISAPVQLLAWTVDFEVGTRSYTFDFGDGTTSEPTTDMGGPYPSGGIRHTYPRAIEAAQVKVDTVLTGRYRINGGPWQDLGSEADLTDEPVTTLQVAEAQARLYSN